MSLQAAYDQLELGSEEGLEWLRNEVKGLRAGRVKPDMINELVIEHYGTRMPLKGAASVSSADARTLTINPWDPSAVPSIQKAIVDAQLGVQPVVDGKLIRLSFPMLTEEVRGQTIKMLHKKAEEARVRLRRSRDEGLGILKKDKQEGDITEDDFYEGREKLDAMIDEANKQIEGIVSTKEEELKTI